MRESKYTCDECGDQITGTYFEMQTVDSFVRSKDLCAKCAIMYANKVINEGYNQVNEQIQKVVDEHNRFMLKWGKKK